MKAGELSDQITFSSVAESNSGGELTRTWSAESSATWCRVYSERGSEAFEAARQNARETIRVKLRYRSDVTDKWRFTWNGQTYYIKYIDRSQRRSGAMFITAEVVGAA